MFLRSTSRKKNGKDHRYWSLVENKRLNDGRIVQRHVLYLGEINSSQEQAWRKSIAVFEDQSPQPRTLSLFPDDRIPACQCDATMVRLRLGGLSVCHPRQWGACWLVLELWNQLKLDRFWAERLPPNRKGTRWDQILAVLAAYRLIAPGSEWQLHRQWFQKSAMADLLGADFRLAESHKLYLCHDYLLKHKEALFQHLRDQWRDLFNAQFEVLLYDLTSTYFESDPPFPDGDKRCFGYSRDKRSDCVQVVIALIVTPEGFPMAYEVMSGNTSDRTTLASFLEKIGKQYGKAQRLWLMDRGIPTEETLAVMRQSDPPVQYLVGTPKGRLTGMEKKFLEKSWQQAREGVEVKILPQEEELYVLAKSQDRIGKERAMRRRKLKWLWKRLRELSEMKLTLKELHMKLGAARHEAFQAWRLVEVSTREKEEPPPCAPPANDCPAVTSPPESPDPGRKKSKASGKKAPKIEKEAVLTYKLRKDKLREIRRREGKYLLRTNLKEADPAKLWSLYMVLVTVEQAFRNLKGDMAIRPVYHQKEERVEAHIFLSFLAYCLHVTLSRRLAALAPGLTARSVLEKFEGIQMVDVKIPTTDGRKLILTRYTNPEDDLKLLLERLKLTLPMQPPPRITASQIHEPTNQM